MNPRVILLEDDELIRIALTRYLTNRDYEVVSASDPSICPIFQKFGDGLLEDQLFGDFLLTDNNMPFMNGLRLVELQVGKECTGGVLYRAVMSASWTEEDIANAERVGCQVFHKPLDMEEVLAWLESGKESLSKDRKLVPL